MRRLKFKQLKRLLRHSHSSNARRIKERQKRLERRRNQSRSQKVTIERQGRSRHVRATPLPGLPQVFCLERNYQGSIGFLNGLRSEFDRNLLIGSATSKRRRRLGRTYYDLAQLQFISPTAALMFAAEYDRILALRPKTNLHVYNVHRWRSDVKSILDQLGFLELLQIQAPAASSPPGNMRMARFAQSELAGNQEAVTLLVSLANLLQLEVVGTESAMRLMGPLRLFDAMVEATENTKLHAYETLETDPRLLVKRWWMTGAVDHTVGQLTVIVYDQGASIPATLPHSQQWGRIKRAYERLKRTPDDPYQTDALSLKLAMSEGATSTGLKKHGKGLGVLKRVVDECENGSLTIRSRFGEYLYQKGKKAQYRQLPIPVNGTLIEWKLMRSEWKGNR